MYLGVTKRKEVKKMKKKGIYISAIVTIVALLFLIPTTVLATYSGQILVAGYVPGSSGEDPAADDGFTPALHPQDSSCGNANNHYVAVVYTIGTGDNARVRMAISNNGGSWFSSFVWVNTQEIKQDYADVQLYKDTVNQDHIRAVVVWQQQPTDESEEWEIKVREYDFVGSVWSTDVLDVSETDISEDDNDNIYPKVSVCSDNSVSYWNIVWQRDWDNLANRYGIYLRRFIRDSDDGDGGSFNDIFTIAEPDDYDDDYRHPATDCILSADYEDVYIIYDEFHQGDPDDDRITLKYGSPSGGEPDGVFSVSGTTTIATSTVGTYGLGYPDIAVVGRTVHKSTGLGSGNTVDCVWISNEDNNEEVEYARSSNGGADFTYITIDDNSPGGDMSLRSVAIDMNISIVGGTPTYRCHIIWTTGSHIYYMDRVIDTQFGYWDDMPDPNDRERGTEDDYVETFVDASASYKASPPINVDVFATWQVSNTAVFFGRA